MRKITPNALTELGKESLLLRCVYLFYVDKMNMQTIGRKLGISRFRVSRYLKEAEEQGIIKIEISDDGGGLEGVVVLQEEEDLLVHSGEVGTKAQDTVEEKQEVPDE